MERKFGSALTRLKLGTVRIGTEPGGKRTHQDRNLDPGWNTTTGVFTCSCKPNTPQYAVATNLRSDACTVEPNQNVFDKDRSARDELINKRLYIGEALLCALPLKSKYHSEYRLLIQSTPNNSKDYLIRGLQQRDNNGCLILYTYYSPCLAQCLNRSHPLTIMNALQTFSQHQGPKAFVFSDIYTNDINNTGDISNLLNAVDSSVPVFRCSAQSCIKCFNNNIKNQNCFT